MNNGYILLHRKVKQNFMWEDKPFAKGQAWIDMIMMAAHEPHEIALGNHKFSLERGQFIRAERTLAEQWGWSQKKVRAFLALGKDMAQIGIRKESKGNLITILNYDEYQPHANGKESKKKQLGIKEESLRKQKNECKNECKNEREKFLDYVFLSKDEHERLVMDYGEEVIESRIEDLDNYIGRNPKKAKEYTDHNRVLRSWLKKDGLKPKTVATKKRITCPKCKAEYGPGEAKGGQCPVCGG